MRSAQTAPLWQLDEVFDLPLAEIGERATRLASLLQKGLPVPTTLVIPASTLAKIFASAGLSTRWLELLSHVEWTQPQQIAEASQHIHHDLSKLQLPREFSTQLFAEILQWFADEFVAIRPSLLDENLPSPHWAELHVKGEANILDSLVRVLQKAYEPNQLLHRWRELKYGQSTPMAIILQRMIPATSSGWMQPKPRSTQIDVEILSQFGLTPTRSVPPQQLDSFVIDLHSELIREQSLGMKVTAALSKLDGVYYKQLDEQHHNQASLATPQIRQLATMYRSIFHFRIVPPLVEWAAIGDEVFILDAIDAAPAETPRELSIPTVPKSIDTPPPILAELGVVHLTTNEDGHKFSASNATQAALFTTGQLTVDLQAHPQQLIEDHHQARWHDVVVRLMQLSLDAQPKYSTSPILLQASNLKTSTLSHLIGGKEFEPVEANPLLGYHGAVRYLHNPAFLDLELDILTTIHQMWPQRDAGIVIPFVRTISEWGMIEKHVRHAKTGTELPPKLWLEIDLPINLMQLQGYLHYRPDGVIINWPMISALAQGLDPANKDLTPTYANDQSLLESVVLPALQTLKQHTIPVYFWTTNRSAALTSVLAEWGASTLLIDQGSQHIHQGVI